MTAVPDGLVAVTGLACRFPGAPDADAFWDLLAGERDGLTRLTDDELAAAGVPRRLRRDPDYVPVAGLIDGQDLFDPGPFGLAEAEAALLDPQHRLFLECCWRALEQAGHGGGTGAGSVGVFAGSSQSAYLASNLAGRWDPTGGGADPAGSLQAAIATQPDYMPAQAAYRLGLTGPATAVNTACSTSLVAVHLAVQALLAGECDTALAGGVSLIVPQGRGHLFTPDGIYSRDGRVRPFSAEGTGIVYTQGAGTVVLRRLRDALDDGDPVLAVVHGSAVGNDGADKTGFTAPSVRGQARVVAEALALAGAGPRDVGYVEAHGTGTHLGDPIEVAALRRVFGDAGPAWCGLGSVKGNIGHANTAAGIASFIKAVLAVRAGVLPASLHAAPVNELLGLDGSPFDVVTRTRAWDGPRLAGVSSFGIGGTNAHVVVGPAPERPRTEPDARPHPIVLSAASPAALTATAGDLADWFDREAPDPSDLAHTLQRGRRHLPYRVAARPGDLRAAAAPGAPVGGPPRLVFAFPGGGNARVGMGAALYDAEPVFAACVDECAELLAPHLGFDVRAVIRGAEGKIETPLRGLPALFAVSLATARLLASWGVRPDAVLGHSAGEYTAAVAAGALDAADVAPLLAVRCRAMTEVAGEGVMLAVPLDEDATAARLRDHPALDLAVVNGPGACVVSGPRRDVDALAADLEHDGLDTSLLRFDVAAHSRLIDPALPRLRRAAEGLRAVPPRVPLVSTLTGTPVNGELGTPGHWVRQLREPVRFSAALRAAAGPGTVVVHVGPGTALAALARRHGLPALPTLADGDDLAALFDAAGKLWAHGVDVDFAAMHRPGRRRIAAPGHAFLRRRLWIDPPAEPSSRPSGGEPDETEPLQVPVWRQVPPLDAPAALDGSWIVAGPPGEATAALVGALADAGADAVPLAEADRRPDTAWTGVIVLPGAERTRPPEPASTGLGAAGPRPGRTGAAGPADPEGTRPAEPADPGEAGAGVADDVLLYAELARRFFVGERPAGVLVQVTRGAQRVGGGDRPDPGAAAVHALPRVLAQEQRGVRWRVVDLDDAAEPGAVVPAELADLVSGGSGAETAVRDGTRWVRDLAPWRPAARPPADGGAPIAPVAPVALVTGGLGDVGRTVARHLVRRGMRVVVTTRGRTDAAAPPGVEVVRLDAADTGGTARLLDELSGGGPLALVVHAAGAAASAAPEPLRSTGSAQVAAHVRAKVAGTLALRAAIEGLAAGRRPRAVVLMSSVGGLVGGIGMGAYCAANRFMDAFAEAAAGPTRWVSVQWDVWRAETVRLPYALSEAVGMPALDRVLAHAGPPVVAVSSTDLRERAAGAAYAEPVAAVADGGGAELGAAQRRVAELWTELLGVAVTRPDDDFFVLGGHSLLATRMLRALRDATGAELRLRDLLDRPTVGGLAALLPDAAPDRRPEPEPAPPSEPERAPDGTFPMTRVQHAYWVGRGGGYALGRIPCHFYLEYDCPDLDLARYEEAWRRVIARHPMLRAIVTPQGRLKVLDHVPPYRIRVTDLTGTDGTRRAERLARLRDRVSRDAGPPDRWPLVQIRAARLPGGRVRLFIGVDVLVCDAGSYWIVDREVRHFYEHPDAPLPEPGIGFAACVRAAREAQGGADGRRAAAYWRDRIAALPAPPPLPVAEVDGPPEFERRTASLRPDAWAALRAESARRGLTPTSVLLTAYAETLARWSGAERFALTLTLFDRPPIHPDVDRVVGDFTSLLLHEIDRRGPGTFAGRARAVRDRLFDDLDHRAHPVLDTLAETGGRAVPVVFTSALGLEDLVGGEPDLQWVGEQVHALSRTPQTWLDHQVLVQRGELLLQWDAVRDLLPAAQVDEAFAAYEARVRRLAEDPAAWDEPDDAHTPANGPAAVLADSPTVRDVRDVRAANVLVPLRDGTGDRTLFLLHPSGGDVMCYAELSRLLDERFSVVAITDPAFADVAPPAGLDDLAALYRDAIRARAPHGPYLLGGWSMGGSLGQEVACGLADGGGRVGLLAMLDSNDPSYITPVPGDGEAEATVRMLGALEAFLGADLGVGDDAGRAALRALPAGRRRAEAAGRLRAHGL
ncbi:SDR family NAD(P)-dependent oxidoreductase, partial [Actinomadura sp. LOL_016]|uniref:SDR family NAD(P)-dependent oxidoreductase n=2 Tax=unclassified Actinomadura TaxID=2626254 RepID=UPI003A89EA53